MKKPRHYIWISRPVLTWPLLTPPHVSSPSPTFCPGSSQASAEQLSHLSYFQQFPGLSSRDVDSVSLRWGPRMCIFSKGWRTLIWVILSPHVGETLRLPSPLREGLASPWTCWIFEVPCPYHPALTTLPCLPSQPPVPALTYPLGSLWCPRQVWVHSTLYSPGPQASSHSVATCIFPPFAMVGQELLESRLHRVLFTLFA